MCVCPSTPKNDSKAFLLHEKTESVGLGARETYQTHTQFHTHIYIHTHSRTHTHTHTRVRPHLNKNKRLRTALALEQKQNRSAFAEGFNKAMNCILSYTVIIFMIF